MTVIGRGAGARTAIEAFHADNPIMYMQQKIELPGQDLGIVFLGGKYMTTYARCGTGAWNTTTESGGKYAPATPSSEAVTIAEKAQALFSLDFTCVDVVETASGPVVFEVSAFGGFRGIQDACGLDAAAMYADYVMEKIRGS
jgi:ribosomal protein S6--L-glutamate ligase